MKESRGCGDRVAGGIYLEIPIAADGEAGLPLHKFLIDPPIWIDPEEIGLSAMGVSIIADEHGVHHVFDIVGAAHYPNLSDFIEEAMRLGISRRISSLIDFSLITKESRLILAHPRAIMVNHPAFRKYLRSINVQPICPCGREEHTDHKFPEMCLGLSWEMIDGLMTVGDNGSYARHMPAFDYLGANHLQPWQESSGERAEFSTGFFASLPIAKIAVIRDRENPDVTMKKMARASASGVGVSLEES